MLSQDWTIEQPQQDHVDGLSHEAIGMEDSWMIIPDHPDHPDHPDRQDQLDHLISLNY